MDENLIVNALQLAQKHHLGQWRRGLPIPYICHPLDVYKLMVQDGETNTDILCASLLHDVLEDTDCTKEEIIDATSCKTYDLVKRLTFNPDISTKEQYLDTILYDDSDYGKETRYIKVCDRVCNLRDFLASNSPKFIDYYQQTKPLFHKYDSVEAHTLVHEEIYVLSIEYHRLKKKYETV